MKPSLLQKTETNFPQNPLPIISRIFNITTLNQGILILEVPYQLFKSKHGVFPYKDMERSQDSILALHTSVIFILKSNLKF